MASSKEHYIKIWALLVALLVVSVIGPMAGVLILTLITAFGIALVKAYMVVVHFMHLPLDKKYASYLLATCLAFMLLFFAFVAPDVMNHKGRNWVNTSAMKETKCVELIKTPYAKKRHIDKPKCKSMKFAEVEALEQLASGKSGKTNKKHNAPKTHTPPKK